MNGVPITISGAASCPGYGASTSLEYLNGYCPGSWAFPSIIPAGYDFWAQDFVFQSKNIQPSVYGLWRNSYFILYGLTSVVESQGGQQHYQNGLWCPSGFKVTGVFCNQSTETQNMLGIVCGLLVPVDKKVQFRDDVMAERSSLYLAHRNQWLAEKSRLGGIRADDMAGGFNLHEPIPSLSLWQRFVRKLGGRG